MILIALLGVCFVDDTMNTQQQVVSYSAGLISFVSLALSLTHFRNPTQAVLFGIPLVLIGCAMVLAAGNVTMMMLGLVFLSIGLFLKSVIDIFKGQAKSSGAAYSNDSVPVTRELFEDDDADPFLHNHSGIVPYAADD